jgi:hypothetical protein
VAARHNVRKSQWPTSHATREYSLYLCAYSKLHATAATTREEPADSVSPKILKCRNQSYGELTWQRSDRQTLVRGQRRVITLAVTGSYDVGTDKRYGEASFCIDLSSISATVWQWSRLPPSNISNAERILSRCSVYRSHSLSHVEEQGNNLMNVAHLCRPACA